MRWKLVPVEPTEKMVTAGFEWSGYEDTAPDVYDAMLAAAPPASQDEELVEKVAKRLCEAVNQVWPEHRTDNPDGAYLTRLMYLRQARAVLKMLEGGE